MLSSSFITLQFNVIMCVYIQCVLIVTGFSACVLHCNKVASPYMYDTTFKYWEILYLGAASAGVWSCVNIYCMHVCWRTHVRLSTGTWEGLHMPQSFCDKSWCICSRSCGNKWLPNHVMRCVILLSSKSLSWTKITLSSEPWFHWVMPLILNVTLELCRSFLPCVSVRNHSSHDLGMTHVESACC